ncbi:hypothetical protein E2C01_029560 [Portunus trituberculatus]|uniref:Uncharacterized protein n=1 Tax=Portunus trituberculatus TaxID=210409 RepID=A0A5B7EPN9_PORTR|nr:hypothetical protein [Portunus trituberculatus]
MALTTSNTVYTSINLAAPSYGSLATAEYTRDIAEDCLLSIQRLTQAQLLDGHFKGVLGDLRIIVVDEDWREAMGRTPVWPLNIVHSGNRDRLKTISQLRHAAGVLSQERRHIVQRRA